MKEKLNVGRALLVFTGLVWLFFCVAVIVTAAKAAQLGVMVAIIVFFFFSVIIFYAIFMEQG